MSMRLNPYLQFGTTAAKALEFYRGVFGGEVALSHFKEFGTEGADGDLVMHGQLETPAGFTIMAADFPSFISPRPRSPTSRSASAARRRGDARLLGGPLRGRHRGHAAREADVG